MKKAQKTSKENEIIVKCSLCDTYDMIDHMIEIDLDDKTTVYVCTNCFQESAKTGKNIKKLINN